ncbi:hypothetical protein TorRG33x02_221060 [Trema orientale]|uniref:Uncharacterized protein n=1 Tax=Trema orientale TaxID=63057 RepID=A0A2P5E9B9_TREOI|nr:hypothetical protein TorRG33x02_221060 [Trema orientale]
MKTLKKNSGAARKILNTSGFGFNYSAQRIEAAVGAHPKSSQFRYKSIRNYDKPDELVGNDRAMGSLAAGPNERLYHWAREEPLLDDNTSQFESTERGVGDDNIEPRHEESSAGESASSSKKKERHRLWLMVEFGDSLFNA